MYLCVNAAVSSAAHLIFSGPIGNGLICMIVIQLAWCLIFCIPNMLPDNAEAVGQKTPR